MHCALLGDGVDAYSAWYVVCMRSVMLSTGSKWHRFQLPRHAPPLPPHGHYCQGRGRAAKEAYARGTLNRRLCWFGCNYYIHSLLSGLLVSCSILSTQAWYTPGENSNNCGLINFAARILRDRSQDPKWQRLIAFTMLCFANQNGSESHGSHFFASSHCVFPRGRSIEARGGQPLRQHLHGHLGVLEPGRRVEEPGGGCGAGGRQRGRRGRPGRGQAARAPGAAAGRRRCQTRQRR